MQSARSVLPFPSRLVPWAIVLAALVWIPWELSDGGPGITIDEPAYVFPAAYYVGIRPPDPSLAGSRWEYNHEHPPLAKLLMGLGQSVWFVFSGSEQGYLLGARAAVMVLFAALLVGVWCLALPLGEVTAAAAVVFCAASPRLLGHAGLATLDVPLTCAWVWTLAAFERATRADLAARHRRVWQVLACLLFGAALLTKFTGVVLPIVLMAWIVVQAFHSPAADRGRWLRRSAPMLAVLVASGLVLFLFCWPWLWHDTWPRVREYITFSVRHYMTPVRYLGSDYGVPPTMHKPPWHYAPVMLAVTSPLAVTVGLLLCVALRAIEVARNRVLSLAVLGALALPCATMLPNGVAYDGVRLFLPALPLGCVLAAFGWTALAERLGARVRRAHLVRLAPLGLAFCCLIFGRLAITDDLSYYTLAVGGPHGAVDLGFQPAYWPSSATRPRLLRIQAEAARSGLPPEKRRYVLLEGFGGMAKILLTGMGIFPMDTRFVNADGPLPADWGVAIVANRPSLGDIARLESRVRDEHIAVRTTAITGRVWPTRPIPLVKAYWKIAPEKSRERAVPDLPRRPGE